MRFVSITEQTAYFAPYNVKCLVVYNRDGECLLRGTNWFFKYIRFYFFLKGMK